MSSLMPKPIREKPVLGIDVFHWPEFIVFATRLGIPLDQRIEALSININADNHCKYEVKIQAVDMEKPDASSH